MTNQNSRKTTLIDKELTETRDLPTQVDKTSADKVKGGFAKPNVDATKKAT